MLVLMQYLQALTVPTIAAQASISPGEWLTAHDKPEPPGRLPLVNSTGVGACSRTAAPWDNPGHDESVRLGNG
jgi:hypothetical protein